ncbi:MAG: hypothetical protein ACREJM_04830, partial [Candidatus Saccharimonadales bacterium]
MKVSAHSVQFSISTFSITTAWRGSGARGGMVSENPVASRLLVTDHNYLKSFLGLGFRGSTNVFRDGILAGLQVGLQPATNADEGRRTVAN